MAREQVPIAECKTMWLHAAVWGRKRLRAVVMNSDGHDENCRSTGCGLYSRMVFLAAFCSVSCLEGVVTAIVH